VALLGADDPLAERLSSVTMTPLWALMVAPNRASGHAFDAARIDGSPFTWMMRTPRDAGQPECWTFHLSPEWSRRHLELEPAQVMDELRPEAARLLNNDELRHIDAHRWRHALAGSPLGEPCLSDPARNLIIVGDWCLGDRVEHAWLSGKSVESDL
jgi:renalase